MFYKIIKTSDGGSSRPNFIGELEQKVSDFIHERSSFNEKWIPTGGVCVLLQRSGGSHIQSDKEAYQALMRVS